MIQINSLLFLFLIHSIYFFNWACTCEQYSNMYTYIAVILDTYKNMCISFKWMSLYFNITEIELNACERTKQVLYVASHSMNKRCEQSVTHTKRRGIARMYDTQMHHLDFVKCTPFAYWAQQPQQLQK